MKLKTGTVIEGYKILAEAGSGACGTVFQAINTISNEIVALKVIPCQGSLPERELNALKLYQQLEHPHLIRVRHVGTYEEHIYYTMDWCESSLAQRKVSADELLEIAEGIADALNLLHKKGLLHRDIKPDNIFFHQGKAVLGDVGLLTNLSTATFAGSPGFLAPSLLQGHAPDMYSDCYALAKTIYCALSGQEPTQFPVYEGDLSPAAAKLMQCILSVCGVEPKIRTAEGILAFLTKQQVNITASHRKKYLIYFFAALVIIFFLILLYYPWKTNRVTVTKSTTAEKKMVDPGVPATQIREEKKNTPLPAQHDITQEVKNMKEKQQFFKLFPKGSMSVYTIRNEIEKEFPECQLNKIQEEKWEKTYRKWYRDSMKYKKQALNEFKQTGESILSILERQKQQDPVTQFFLTCHADMEDAYEKQSDTNLSPEERTHLHDEYRKKLAVFIRERNRLLNRIKN